MPSTWLVQSPELELVSTNPTETTLALNYKSHSQSVTRKLPKYSFLSASWTFNDAEECDKTMSDDVKKDDKAVVSPSARDEYQPKCRQIAILIVATMISITPRALKTQNIEERGEWDSSDKTYIQNFRYFILDMLSHYCPAKLPFGSDYYQNLTLPNLLGPKLSNGTLITSAYPENGYREDHSMGSHDCIASLLGPSGSPHSGHGQVARDVLMLKSLTGHIVVHGTACHTIISQHNHLVLASLSQGWIQGFNASTIRPHLVI
ncbi:hypothetical protein K439DRAFT_1622778 [Ramaria rubella]|nr:hypothetical protein K439DRAFT_1622778 [Ramaria rubella]